MGGGFAERGGFGIVDGFFGVVGDAVGGGEDGGFDEGETHGVEMGLEGRFGMTIVAMVR